MNYFPVDDVHVHNTLNIFKEPDLEHSSDSSPHLDHFHPQGGGMPLELSVPPGHVLPTLTKITCGITW